MKKWIATGLLFLLAVVFFVTSLEVHDLGWLFNCLPVLIWAVVIAICQRRWPSLGNSAAVILGIGYGALAGVGAAALFLALLTAAMTDRYYRYPYDSAAFAVILLLALILFVALAVVDYVKLRWKPLWVRIVTVLVTFFPCMLMAMQIMAYFEGVLSQYVS